MAASTRDLIDYTSNPCEHFAAVAYAAIVAAIPESDYIGEHPYPNDSDEDNRPGCQRRWLDLHVLHAIRGPEVKDRKKTKPAEGETEAPVTIAGHRIDWHLYLPELKIWAGGANMESLTKGRRHALHQAGNLPIGVSLREWRLPYPTMSGLDPRTAATNLDIGFSPAKLGMSISTYVADELLAVLGMQLAPIIRYGRREFGYVDPHGHWWKFRVEDREGYHRMFGWASPRSHRDALKQAVRKESKGVGG